MSGPGLKDRYFEAAKEILATEGYGGLKLAAVCKYLGVTTGSFYHSFESWGDFTNAFLLNWRRERTTLLAELAKSGDPVAQLEALKADTLELRHGSEAAIRVWAAVDPEVARIQHLVDHERFEIVLDAMQRIVGKKDAAAFTKWGLNVLIGFEVAGEQTPRDLEWQLNQVLAAALARAEEREASRRRSA